jgi:hypothetical protein
MSEHHFINTGRVKYIKSLKKHMPVWRCEKCDSEVVFNNTLTEREVNQAVIMKWPRFHCIAFNKAIN